MKTTLNKIKSFSPPKDEWEKLLRSLNKIQGDDEELSILYILDTNGFEQAVGCLRAVEGYDKEIRLFMAWCARQVQHMLKDQRSINALDVSERFANGQASAQELLAAKEAAQSASLDANLDACLANPLNAAKNAATAAATNAVLVALTRSALAAANAAYIAASWEDNGDAAQAAQEKEFRRILSN